MRPPSLRAKKERLWPMPYQPHYQAQNCATAIACTLHSTEGTKFEQRCTKQSEKLSLTFFIYLFEHNPHLQLHVVVTQFVGWEEGDGKI